MKSDDNPVTCVDSMTHESLETNSRRNRTIPQIRVGPNGELIWLFGNVMMTTSTSPPDNLASEK